jgi:ribonuclease G
MTRQNVTEGVREILTRPCPTCDGDGVIKSEETIAIEFERRMRDLGQRAKRDVEAFLVQMNPRVSAQFTGNGSRVLHELEQESGKVFFFTGSEGLPLDHFDVVMEGKTADVEERAIPFSAGDEVLVHIIEPHMYEVDDAVAKIDGYIVSVAGGGRFVGEKRLVRIEEPGRTAAKAVLLDDSPRASNGDDGDDALESKPRRRGRRGGRRRSAAKAESTASE